MEARVRGAVRATGHIYVDDKRETLEIWVNKANAKGLPCQDHVRINVNLFIGSSRYLGGLRCKPRTPYVWICPDLRDPDDKKVSLAKILNENGFRKNDHIVLIANGKDIHLIPGLS